MAIANGTCVSFCNQPKAHYLATSRESRQCVVAYSRFAGAARRHLARLRQESLRHIFASPGYAPGNIAVNVRPYTWLVRGFNACKMPCCIYTHLQPFLRYSDISVASIGRKLRHFHTLFSGPAGGMVPSEFREDLDTHCKILIHTIQSIRMNGLSCGEESMIMFSRIDTIPASDRRTDVQPIAKTCFSIADARKNIIRRPLRQLPHLAVLAYRS